MGFEEGLGGTESFGVDSSGGGQGRSGMGLGWIPLEEIMEGFWWIPLEELREIQAEHSWKGF